MILANNKQKGAIGALVAKLNLQGQKATIVAGFTGGRAESTTDMYSHEANAMIKHLKSLDADEQKADVMRKKIISMAHEMGWRLPGTTEADMKRIDKWCVQYGKCHKKINSHLLKELPDLVTQFEMVYKKHLNGI